MLSVLHFLDAIASPSTYPCQSVSGSVSGSVIDSFRLEIAIASPSFVSSLLFGFATMFKGFLQHVKSKQNCGHAKLDSGWCVHLGAVLRKGGAEATFRKALSPAAAPELLSLTYRHC